MEARVCRDGRTTSNSPRGSGTHCTGRTLWEVQGLAVSLRRDNRRVSLLIQYIHYSSGSKIPGKVQDLLAYSSRIVNASRPYYGAPWLSYDIHFHRQMAAQKSGSFATLDASIRTLYFGRATSRPVCRDCFQPGHNSCKSASPSSAKAPRKKAQPYQLKLDSDICRRYNSPAGCNVEGGLVSFVTSADTASVATTQCRPVLSSDTAPVLQDPECQEPNHARTSYLINSQGHFLVLCPELLTTVQHVHQSLYTYSYTQQLCRLDSFVSSTKNIVSNFCPQIVTPLHWKPWRQALLTHPDRVYVKYILDGISEGFRVGFDHANSPLRSSPGNMRSAVQNPQVVQDYLVKEQLAGRVIELPSFYLSGAY